MSLTEYKIVEGFYKTYFDIIQSIEDSIEKGRVIPGLILLYSAIDSFSSLAENSNNLGRKVFKEWVKKWMLEKYSLPCNEIDLYSARCGLLHQQISESNLTEKKEAREIYYVWGDGKRERLQEAIDNSDKKEVAVAVKIEDLIWSFRYGMVDCMAEIQKDYNWKNSFDIKIKKLFVSINHEV